MSAVTSHTRTRGPAMISHRPHTDAVGESYLLPGCTCQLAVSLRREDVCQREVDVKHTGCCCTVDLWCCWLVIVIPFASENFGRRNEVDDDLSLGERFVHV
ncbi:unnamed protein product [Pleuronectes platessa]|uniref:Uncharacterized protein n=1 Tax=Pleuronectes platessa TaxID=8262 RepID=A0A9N7VTB9_PLEPL|nr:unnamed protein product [Pleuronectes platessa]